MKNPLSLLLRGLILFYRKAVSPYRPPRCRYIPTCSSYALTAIERFGPLRGGLLAIWRLLSCNPFSPGGFDPVPDFFTFRRQFAPPRRNPKR